MRLCFERLSRSWLEDQGGGSGRRGAGVNQ